MERRRGEVRAAVARGDALEIQWTRGALQELFSPTELAELREQIRAVQAEQARDREAAVQRREVVRLADAIQQEWRQAERVQAEGEARRRLGLAP
jgi:dihydroxyacid dehydratase/phosphogluconate dehydratase